MDSFDDMDIEDMINNPFKNVDLSGKGPLSADSKGLTDRKKGRKWDIQSKKEMTDDDYERMEKNHPLIDRMFSLEKNLINTDKKFDTLKRIIEEQNERIGKLEDELDILRKHLGAVEIDSEENNEQE